MRPATIVMLGDIQGPAKYHVGDEAIFTASLAWLREDLPAAHIVAVSADPAFTASVHGVDAVPEPVWPRRLALAAARARIPTLARLLAMRAMPRSGRALAFARAIVGADLLYLCGGGNLRTGFPDALLLRTLAAELAVAARVPFVAAGQTLGPDLAPEDRAVLSSWLPLAEQVGVRDDLQSPAWAEALGVDPSRVAVQPDEAWSLEPLPPPDEATPRARDDARLVVVSVHRSRGARLPPAAAERALVPALDALVAAGARLLFVPHVTGAVGHDLALARRLHATLERPDLAEVVSAPLSDRQVKGLTARADLVLATRFHAVVFALSSRVPCLGIAQDDYTGTKLTGAFRVAGLAPQLADLEDPSLPQRAVGALCEPSEREALARGDRLARERLGAFRAGLSKTLRGALERRATWT